MKKIIDRISYFEVPTLFALMCGLTTYQRIVEAHPAGDLIEGERPEFFTLKVDVLMDDGQYRRELRHYPTNVAPQQYVWYHLHRLKMASGKAKNVYNLGYQNTAQMYAEFRGWATFFNEPRFTPNRQILSESEQALLRKEGLDRLSTKGKKKKLTFREVAPSKTPINRKDAEHGGKWSKFINKEFSQKYQRIYLNSGRHTDTTEVTYANLKVENAFRDLIRYNLLCNAVVKLLI